MIKFLQEQEANLEVAKMANRNEADLFANDPVKYSEVYGQNLSEVPIDDSGVFYPTTEEEFEIVLQQLETEGVILEE